MIWNYIEDNIQRGPVTDEDLDALVRSGKIDEYTLVWREGMAEWQPYKLARGTVAGTTSPAPSIAAEGQGPSIAAEGQLVCVECGGAFAPDQVIRHGNVYICAACKPVFLQKLKEGVALPGTLNYAGFGIRFGAKFLDGILLYVVTLPLTLAIQGLPGSTPNPARSLITFPISLAVALTYYTLFVGKYGATPGKMATKLRIVNPDGSKVSYGKALGRYFAAEYISGCFTLCIGYLMVLWDDEKRALHDRICSTRVIRK
jgi:uncharacterized RDD family membrane protein YckC